MRRISFNPSFTDALTDAAAMVASTNRSEVPAFGLEAGAAVERICESPGIGRPMGGVMFSHALTTFPFAVIYEVTDTELCFLYLATR